MEYVRYLFKLLDGMFVSSTESLPETVLDVLQRLLAFMGIIVALIAIPYYTYKLMNSARPPLVIENQHPVNDYYG